jgi:putative GTP pyrophosphokinase
MTDIAGLLNEHEAMRGLHEDLGVKLEGLIEELLAEHGIDMHSVGSRVKATESLIRKVRQSRKSGKEYPNLAAVTDVLGARIITYFPSDVDRVAEVVESEFDIDYRNSVDRRDSLAPDTFGYLSLHYVAKLSPERLGLLEYRRFSQCVFEIQIRSILQHAWAEIEHDLGYKSKHAVPRSIRRKFSQIAGLLEVADESFDEIRKSLREYEAGVEEALAHDPNEVGVDQVSLFSFVTSNPTVREIDLHIARIVEQDEIQASAEYATGLSNELQLIGLETIGEVQQALEQRRDVVERFAEAWLTRPDEEEDAAFKEYFEALSPEEQEAFRESESHLFSAGISLFYLFYVLIAETGSPEAIAGLLESAGIGGYEDDKTDLAQEVLGTFAEVAEADTSEGAS